MVNSQTHNNIDIDFIIAKLEKIILDTLDFNNVVNLIVNKLLIELNSLSLGYRIIVLGLVDEKKGILKRTSASQTVEAKKALELSPIPLSNLDVKLTAKKNYCIKALMEKKIFITHDWSNILTPPLDCSDAKKMQIVAGIKTSIVSPLVLHDKSIGIMIFSKNIYINEISSLERKLITRITDIVALAVQNSRLYSSLEKTTQRLQRANKKLQELDDLKDEFVSLASHELRTPMTAIKSYLWMALNRPSQPLPPDIQKYLNICYTSTEILIRLVNDMLTVSRIERKKIVLHLGMHNLYEIVKQVYDELKVIADEHEINLSIHSLAKNLPIEGDKDRLREIFQNIVGNALKFTPAKGKIAITITATSDFYLVAVSDSGPGIPKDQLPRLFGKFERLDYSYTTHANAPGTGLGLYISKQIATLHYGTIEVQSDVGKGSTFTVVLPKTQPKEVTQNNGTTA